MGQSVEVNKNFRFPKETWAQTPLYLPRRLRALRVVLDESSLSDLEDAQAAAMSHLRGLLTNEWIRVWKYADDGPPTGRGSRRARQFLTPDGWLVVKESGTEAAGDFCQLVTYVDNDRVVKGDIPGHIGRGDLQKSDRTHAHLPPAEAAVRRRADSVVFGAAGVAKTDILVTTRPFVLSDQRPKWEGPVACDPTDALALVGRYLRSGGQYVAVVEARDERSVAQRPFPMYRLQPLVSRSTFLRVAACALVPAAQEWSARFEDGAVSGDVDGLIAQSVLRRFERTLIDRDALLWLMYLPQDRDSADDALTVVSQIMIRIAGSFDGLARMVHHMLDLPPDSIRSAGWQHTKSKQWLRQVASKAPAIAAPMAGGERAAVMFKIVLKLRNTIHAAELQPVRVHDGGLGSGQQSINVALPHDEATDLVNLIRQLRWEDALDLQDWGIGSVWVDAVLLIEHIIVETADALSKIMQSMLDYAGAPETWSPSWAREISGKLLRDPETRSLVLGQLGLNPIT